MGFNWGQSSGRMAAPKPRTTLAEVPAKRWKSLWKLGENVPYPDEDATGFEKLAYDHPYKHTVDTRIRGGVLDADEEDLLETLPKNGVGHLYEPCQGAVTNPHIFDGSGGPYQLTMGQCRGGCGPQVPRANRYFHLLGERMNKCIMCGAWFMPYLREDIIIAPFFSTIPASGRISFSELAPAIDNHVRYGTPVLG